MIVDVLIELFSGIISSLTGFSDSFIELFFRKKQILKDEKKSKLQGNKIIIPRPETDEELSLR